LQDWPTPVEPAGQRPAPGDGSVSPMRTPRRFDGGCGERCSQTSPRWLQLLGRPETADSGAEPTKVSGGAAQSEQDRDREQHHQQHHSAMKVVVRRPSRAAHMATDHESPTAGSGPRGMSRGWWGPAPAEGGARPGAGAHLEASSANGPAMKERTRGSAPEDETSKGVISGYTMDRW